MTVTSGPPYPWQRTQWELCLKQFDDKRLPHALLLHGNGGLGINAFATRFAAAILCQGDAKRPDDRPCGTCRACHLIATGNHPDLFVIEQPGQGGTIKVDAVREMIDFVQITGHYAQIKVVVILDVDMMNHAAANSLLKTLEEPPQGVVIVLTTQWPSRLPITVRSRCQGNLFPSPPLHEAAAWLSEKIDGSIEEIERMLTDSLPANPLDAYDALYAGEEQGEVQEDCLAVVQGKADLIQVAEKWAKSPPRLIHRRLLEAVHKLIRDHYRQKRRLPENLSIRRIFTLYDRQVERYRLLKDIALNPQLTLENALMEWRSVLSPSDKTRSRTPGKRDR